ncbi:methylmalonyl-CoA mutase subunit beta [Spongiivirga sp. MCCC 1A20706]|uniref:methylmalonyl-CoA mutase subunit beta n=1 Tax=Spongiivirga sp. MCCC 1A20706 TaxID=3160963 RepID=UPI0039776DAD
MSDFLFEDFEAVSLKQWKQKIQVDLKGLDYNDSLVWKTNEGIDVKPAYHQDGLSDTIPNLKTSKGWSITQHIYVLNTEQSNKNALDIINRGAEAIIFELDNQNINLATLLGGINLSNITVYLKPQFLNADVVTQINQLIDSTSNVFMLADPIGQLAKSGNWFQNSIADLETLDQCISNAHNLKSIVAVNTDLYHNAGATVTQQLAYTLAHVNEYINHINEYDQDHLKDLCVTINMAVGSNYFFELAKLRAVRFLFKQLANEYDSTINCHIIVSPGKRNKTLYDYNVNMLRSTTECMSAILGGADAVYNLPYDAIYHKNNEFGDRIARNQLLILKNESYFDKVENPSDGSYYIESLSIQLAEKALALFKDIEKAGGFLKQLKEGVIQRKIKEAAAKQQQQFDDEQNILIGTNKYPNKQDKMKENLELFPFMKTKPRKTSIEPIIEKRLAEVLEQKRLDTEE